MKPEQTFRLKAPWLMRRLIAEFNISILDAAAVAGNGGHESGGFTKLQEIKPVVKGSRGGYGWFQWTGPRRRDYEAWCKAKGLDPASDEANYGFLVHELRTTEKKAVPATMKAKTLRDKVIAFEMAYERAGVKHYDSRVRWAEIALDAHKKASAKPVQPVPPAAPVAPAPKPAPTPAPTPAPSPKPPEPDMPVADNSGPPPAAGRNVAAIVLGAAGALIAALAAWLIGG